MSGRRRGVLAECLSFANPARQSRAAYSFSYSRALAGHEKSPAIALAINFCHFFGCRWTNIACRTAFTNAADVYGTNLKPVPRPVRGVYALTVSSRPPVARTTGIVPYFRA